MHDIIDKYGTYPRMGILKLMSLAGWNHLDMASDAVWDRLRQENYDELRPLVDQFSDEQARVHFGENEPLEHELYRRVVRYFHAWRVITLRRRIGPRLPSARIVDIGDSDGMILKRLGKTGVGFNLSPDAVRNIARNGIEARMGDGHELPFADGEFDYVLCFETLEHVESPYQVLQELSRICRSDGRIFVTIPWVPRTYIHPRDPAQPRGTLHIFEFCHNDFLALASHVPLRPMWQDVCWVFGKSASIARRVFLFLHRPDHIVAGTFKGFQFLELAPIRE